VERAGLSEGVLAVELRLPAVEAWQKNFSLSAEVKTSRGFM
jgi:hypothetical protein